jgi:glycine dehydrogenase subunit 1
LKGSHPYLPNSVPKVKERMMRDIGINSIAELYNDVPENLKLKRKLELPGPYSESEMKKIVQNILDKNVSLNCTPFLGGGVWPHYVPAVVEEIVHRSEFLTSYTPYQPEISQGMLQALFEYQSILCELVGLEVANCSMYDWASALGEASRMASRLTHRYEFIVPYLISPERLNTLKTYAEPAGIKVSKVRYDSCTGQLDLEDLSEKVSRRTAGVYIENPTYLGFVENQVGQIEEIAHDSGALLVVGVDPISLGVLKAPGAYGADIVIGEGQPLGNHMNYGGPLLGLFACKGDLKTVRQMPGRVVGLTTTIKGERTGFTLTLQTREQHIRREVATSNICTNEALCALAAGVYLSLLGSAGLKELCKLIISRSHYAMKKISALKGIKTPIFKSFHFKEFTVNFDETSIKANVIESALLRKGIQGGKIINNEFPEFGETSLYCITELHSKKDIDQLITVLDEILEV